MNDVATPQRVVSQRTDSRARLSAAWTSIAGMTLELLALSLWLGGLIAIGALAAPVTFHVIHAAPEVASLSAAQQSALAGSIIGGCLRIFNVVSIVCGVILIVAASVRFTSVMSPKQRLIVASGAQLALAITLVQTFGLFPQMDAAQAAGQMGRFDRLHHIYELLAQLQMLCLLWFAGCRAWAASK